MLELEEEEENCVIYLSVSLSLSLSPSQFRYYIILFIYTIFLSSSSFSFSSPFGKFSGKFSWNCEIITRRGRRRFIYIFLYLSLSLFRYYICIYLIIDRVPSREFFSPPLSLLPLEKFCDWKIQWKI